MGPGGIFRLYTLSKTFSGEYIWNIMIPESMDDVVKVEESTQDPEPL